MIIDFWFLFRVVLKCAEQIWHKPICTPNFRPKYDKSTLQIFLIPIPCISAMLSALFWWIHAQFPRFYLSFFTSKCHKKNTTLQRDRQSNGKIFRLMAPLESAQFETYSNFWIAPLFYCYHYILAMSEGQINYCSKRQIWYNSSSV